MRNLLFMVVVAAAFVGCFGGIDSGDGRGDGVWPGRAPGQDRRSVVGLHDARELHRSEDGDLGVNLANLTSVSTGADVHIGHRPFNLTNGNGLVALNALNAFHATTAAAVAAGNCGPPKLVE